MILGIENKADDNCPKLRRYRQRLMISFRALPTDDTVLAVSTTWSIARFITVHIYDP